MQRTARIPREPRFSLVSRKAYEFSTELGICEFPVEPTKIIKQFPNWHLQGWLHLKLNSDKDDPLYEDPLFLERDGSEARTVMFRGDSEYLIVYDERIDNRHRIRWTLAHEIGHIVLGHLVHFNVTALNRRGLTDKQYGVLEKEAHWFAAELLSPKPVIKQFAFQERPQSLGLVCDISKEAATRRLEQIKNPEYNYPTAALRVWRNFYKHLAQGAFYQVMHDNAIQFYNSYIYPELCKECRICLQCEGFITDNKYSFCQNCGQAAPDINRYSPYTNFTGYITVGSVEEIYRQGKVVYEVPCSNGRLEFCPICKSVEGVVTADQCDSCGTATQNRCLSEGKLLSKSHRYCPDCGSEATFKTMYDLLPERLQADGIDLPAIYDDYIECEYWEFIIMSIRNWEKDMKLYVALDDSVAFYDCADMVVFVRSDTEVTCAETGKAAILACLEKYAASPVRNIEVKVARLQEKQTTEASA